VAAAQNKKYDVIVIGAGHNGLTSAAFLAKAGLSVLVLEQNSYIGGAAVSRELHEDWIYSNCSYVCSLLRPEIFRALELAKHGLQIVPYYGSVTFTRDGDFIARYADADVQYREFRRHSPRDADAYLRYRTDLKRFCHMVRPFLLRTPPDPTSLRPKDITELAFMLNHFGTFSENHIYDFMRFLTMSVSDFLDEYFESDLVKAHLAGTGIIGTGLGPCSPGTAYILLHHYMGDIDGHIGAWGFARGGMGAITQAMTSAFKSFGGEVRTDCTVRKIKIRNGRTKGVILGDGEMIKAKIVASNADAKRTCLDLIDPDMLPKSVIRSAKRFRGRGSSGKINIALDGMPTFPALGDGNPLTSGDMHFTDSIERMERAYDDWKNGVWSSDPYLDMVIPTTTDPTMAPTGKHYMSVFVQYCPYTLKDGPWDETKRNQFKETVLKQISEYSPNFRNLILHTEVRTPRDIEDQISLPEGNIFQGEMTLDQILFNRPFPGYAQFRGPVKGLYFCGSSSHPGGGVMAAPGANAAREILYDLERPSTVPAEYTDD